MPETMPTTETTQAPPLHAVPPKTKGRKTADGGAVTPKAAPAEVEAAATAHSQAGPLDLSLATFAAGVALAAWRDDASTMGGERCDTCPYDPETCDRAECPAWGKSEEAKARILASEANRPLNDEEHAIVDAGYERGKRILSEVKAEERERRLTDLLAHMTDAYELAYGEDCPLAKQARAALAEMEQKS